MTILASLILLIASDAPAEAAPQVATTAPVVLTEPDPKTMSQKEIRAFNAQLPRDHPFFIRCVSSPEIGSLVKKIYSCRTNRQWALANQIGNQNARDTVEAMTSKATVTE